MFCVRRKIFEKMVVEGEENTDQVCDNLENANKEVIVLWFFHAQKNYVVFPHKNRLITSAKNSSFNLILLSPVFLLLSKNISPQTAIFCVFRSKKSMLIASPVNFSEWIFGNPTISTHFHSVLYLSCKTVNMHKKLIRLISG